MNRLLPIAAFLALLTVTGCSREGAETPREALVGIAQSYQDGDYEKAAARLVRPEHAAGMKLNGALLAARMKVENAMIAKFGKEAGDMGEARQRQLLVEAAKSAEVKTEGDDATAVVNGQPQHLKRYAGRWYFEPGNPAPSLQVTEVSLQLADSLKRAGDEMSSEIAQGKFPDAAAAKQDWGRRLYLLRLEFQRKLAPPAAQ